MHIDLLLKKKICYKPTLDCQAGGVLGCQLCCTGHGSWAVISLLAKPPFLDINLSHVYI